MSYYDSTPIPPLPATQEEVLAQIERLRRQLEQQLKAAQDEATKKALKRALEIQKQQEKKFKDSLDKLDEETKKRLDALDKKQRERLAAISKKIESDIVRVQKEISKDVNRKMKDLRTDIQDQFEGVNKKIERQQAEIQTINHQMQVMADSVNQLASNIDARFREDEQQIHNIQQDIDEIHQRFQNEDQQAREMVKTAIDLLALVESRTLLDRFAPDNEADDIRNHVRDLTTKNLTGAALTAAADNVITQIWDTERHAAKAKARHDALVEIAMGQVERVLTVVNKNREIEKEVEGGDPMIVENEFWSEGEYGRLEKELNDLMAELEDRYNNNLTEKRVNDIVRRSAEIEGRIMQICAESVSKAILSEARVETVEDIITAMREKGWMLKGLKENNPQNNYMGGEEDNDWRKGVFAILEKNTGEEITIIVDPASDTQNQLIVHQETSGKSEQEVRIQMDAIKHELCESGYTIGDTTSGATHIPEMGSATSLGQAHATEKVREKLQGKNC